MVFIVYPFHSFWFVFIAVETFQLGGWFRFSCHLRSAFTVFRTIIFSLIFSPLLYHFHQHCKFHTFSPIYFLILITILKRPLTRFLYWKKVLCLLTSWTLLLLNKHNGPDCRQTFINVAFSKILILPIIWCPLTPDTSPSTSKGLI